MHFATLDTSLGLYDGSFSCVLMSNIVDNLLLYVQ